MAGLLDGKATLITGAASGIGAAAARIFAREGARLILSDVQTELGTQVAKDLEARGFEAHFITADVSSEEDVRQLIAQCVERLGGLDCAFNNAGIASPPAPLHETSLENWNRTLAINLTGVFLCMREEICAMHEQGGGAIVNTASGSGLIATPGLSPYCASKHGILGITKTAAVENAKAGIRVNAVLPGSTDTPMIQASMDASPTVKKMILASSPTGRLGLPEEIAEAAVWLCSDRASFVSGESMLIDGASVAR
jgi:NAD(P)-dependent dehydrogenase (short-subunit alcohol dehydrogenase family)